MNEKIKQLCEQAKAYATESTKDFTGDDPVVWMDYYTEKFAQLILAEAITVLQKRFMGDLNREDMEVRRCIVDVKKHFGVEE